jgi:plasmid stabilization system protein ParE
MPFTLVITEEAHLDILEAYQYYEEKQKDLGNRFLNALQNCYQSLAMHPEHYSYINEDYHRILRDVKLINSLLLLFMKLLKMK